MTLINIETKEQFKDVIISGESVIMIHKTECSYCKKAKPWLEEEAKVNKSRKIATVNKDTISDLLDAFHVKMYPTFVLIKDGVVQDIFFGDTKEDKVKEFINKKI